ncbi:thioredoxin-like protein [Rhodovulum imhoffii]|uniref:Thioredoxin-like protein n=1 Tax=Rhodovulum imhoffii TaxID=365340 RepID=A0A2T5BUV1_9RHOB|nr:DsbA family protein [Rhodovulum imhoffii]MBK5934900.1 thiol-disulfide oxidoreductase [Rhodovulum imhoffii]PTN03301.1 thioredoxin-like protein [Rhodovulum imhoffii]
MPRYPHMLLGVLAVAALGGFWLTTQTPTLPPIAPAQAQTAKPVAITAMTLGDPQAPVKVQEFASFTCGHCGNFHDDVFKRLKADYIDTGKVHFAYQEVYWDRYALWAGMVARCGGEMRFFGLVDMIYDRQRAWLKAGEPADVAAALQKIGRSAGISEETLSACMQDGDTAQALVAWSDEQTAKHGIDATPSLVIDGRKYSNMSYADLKSILDEKLASKP